MSAFVDDIAASGVPLRSDGTRYPVAFSSPAGTLFADTLTEIVARLIDDYPAHDIDAAFEARLEQLAVLAAQAQALLVAAADRQFDETTLTAMLTDKADGAIETDDWTEDVPLLLLVTNYAPFRSAPAPGGNIVWLDPSTERTFLDSLTRIGAGELFLDETL